MIRSCVSAKESVEMARKAYQLTDMEKHFQSQCENIWWKILKEEIKMIHYSVLSFSV